MGVDGRLGPAELQAHHRGRRVLAGELAELGVVGVGPRLAPVLRCLGHVVYPVGFAGS